MVAIMKTLKFFILLVVALVWITPHASAFFEDDKGSEGSDAIQEMMHERRHYDMVETRKKKSKAAALKRKEREKLLTPFVQHISETPEGIPQQEEKEQTNTVRKAILPPVQADLNKALSEKIFLNFLAVIACFVGVILISHYLRTKK